MKFQIKAQQKKIKFYINIPDEHGGGNSETKPKSGKLNHKKDEVITIVKCD